MAFHIASTGKPGPVLIDLPKDIQTASGSAEYPDSVQIRGYKPNESVHIGQLKKAYKLLKSAKKPLILAGGGVNIAKANELLKEFAEKMNVPVVTTIMGKGASATTHPLYIGNTGMHGKYASNKAVSECDVLFSIGTRFNDRITGDLNEFAKSVDDSYSSVSGTFDVNEDAAKEDSDEESDSSSSSSAYPDEVMKVLRTLKDGEIGPDVIETDTSYYVVKLDKVNDEEATETKKQSIISTRENRLYTDTTEKWLDDADINVEKKVLKTLKVTDNHKFSIATATPEPTEEAAATETPEVTEAAEETEATATPEATEETEATTTPEVTEAASYNTDSSLEVTDGNKVNIDYVGKIDGVAFDGGSTDGKGTDLVIGSGTYIDNFEEQLIGAHPGDKVEVTVVFPDDYQAADLAGKEAVFDVTVNGIYE